VGPMPRLPSLSAGGDRMLARYWREPARAREGIRRDEGLAVPAFPVALYLARARADRGRFRSARDPPGRARIPCRRGRRY
jgi:hypothetical protein